MKISVSIPVGLMALALSALALAGCHHRSEPSTAKTASSPGMMMSQARIVLPAVKGNPAAAYFTLDNRTSAPATLTGVDIVGARKTEMHQTSGGTMAPLTQVRIEPGQQVVFAPGGKHVMVFDLASSLTLSPGGSSEILFHFQDGKTTIAPLRVEAPGGGTSGDMAGMHMGAKQ
jgi:copper(I)-binding protein